MGGVTVQGKKPQNKTEYDTQIKHTQEAWLDISVLLSFNTKGSNCLKQGSLSTKQDQSKIIYC